MSADSPSQSKFTASRLLLKLPQDVFQYFLIVMRQLQLIQYINKINIQFPHNTVKAIEFK